MALKNQKFTESVLKFVDSIESYQEIIEDPEFLRYVAHEIAKIAVREAKYNILMGGTNRGNRRHSENTPSMTRKFSRGIRETREVLNETGEMLKAVKIVSSIVSFGRVIVEVGIKDPNIARIAELNEFGGWTSTDVYVPPRPFLMPAVKEAMELAFSITPLKKAIENAITAKMEGKDWRKAFKSSMPSE